MARCATDGAGLLFGQIVNDYYVPQATHKTHLLILYDHDKHTQPSFTHTHRRQEEAGNLGQLPPWNLKMTTSNTVSVQNTRNLSLAPSALPSTTLPFSLKRRKMLDQFSFALSARRKGVIFVSPRCCAPLEKFLRAPMRTHSL